MRLYTVEKIEKQHEEIRAAVYREVIPIPRFKFREGDIPGAQRPAFDDRDWADFAVGDRWGGYDVVAWFRTWIEVPRAWRDGRVYLRLRVGPRDGGNSTRTGRGPPRGPGAGGAADAGGQLPLHPRIRAGHPGRLVRPADVPER